MSSSAQELEREVEASRAGVEHTIDELRGRLSVGQMVDEGMKYFRESGGGEMTQRLGEQVRSNPLPLVLVGVGLAWLMSGRGQPHLQDRDPRRNGFGRAGGGRSYGYNPYPEYGAAEGDYTGQPSYAEAGLESGSASRTPGSDAEADSDGPGVADRASAAAGWAGDRVGSLGHAGRDAFVRARQTTSDAYHEATDYAGSAYSGVQRGFSDMLEREPLILGAIGLAVGAAIGAALPRTKVEDRLMGERADRLKDEVKHAADEQLDRAADAAEKVYEAAHSEARSQTQT